LVLITQLLILRRAQASQRTRACATSRSSIVTIVSNSSSSNGIIVVPPPGGSGTCCNGDAGGDAEALAIVSYRTTAVGIYRSLPRLELVDISIFVWSESLLKAPLRPHKAALSPGNG
jgi:hypothetical protein